jgi:hypothetical protein
MDKLKLRAFLGRVGQGYDQAIRSGDHQKAQGFMQLIRQAEPIVQQSVSEGGGQQANQQTQMGDQGSQPIPMPANAPDRQLAPSAPAPEQASPSNPPQEQPSGWTLGPTPPVKSQPIPMPSPAQQAPAPAPQTTLAQDSKQETGTSWFDRLFNPVPNPKAQPMFASPQSDQSTLKSIGEAGEAARQATSGLDLNKLINPAPDIPSVQSARLPESKTSLLDALPGAKQGLMGMDDAERAKARAGMYPNVDPVELAQLEKQDKQTAQAAQEKKRQEAIGEAPKWNLGDMLGLLLGGRNYLKSKEHEIEQYNVNKRSINQHYDTLDAQKQFHDAMLAQKQQELGVSYAKNLAQQAEHQDTEQQSNERNAFRSIMQPGVPQTKDTTAWQAEYLRRLRAIQAQQAAGSTQPTPGNK